MKKKRRNLSCNLDFFYSKICFLIVLYIVSITSGAISTNVSLRSSNTPLEFEFIEPNIRQYTDIMVGTKLKIVVNSDTIEYWTADFGVEEPYWLNGFLFHRDPLPAAGDLAFIYESEDGFTKWIGVSTDGDNIAAGDWFIIDYNATDVGDFVIGFYDYAIDPWNPHYYMSFSNVPSRDFNGDEIVNFKDYRIFLTHWQEINCEISNWCNGSDIDMDDDVDLSDLMLFCEFWLEKTG